MLLHCMFLLLHLELPPELHNWLVEMDMVRSESIENVLEEEEEPVDENNEEMRTRTRKAAAVNFNSVKKYLWPGGRVPYTFHPFVSKLLNIATHHSISV